MCISRVLTPAFIQTHQLACFLTRGDLWQSWEEGARVFEIYLLDADWSLNTGNWMWLSASAFFYQYFRVYSPVAFGAKTDKVRGPERWMNGCPTASLPMP